MRFSVEHQHGHLEIHLHETGDVRVVPPLWLRERSLDPTQMDAASHQRLFDPHLMSATLSVEEASSDGDVLWVRFSDGHSERFSAARLLADIDLPEELPAPRPWRSDLGRPPAHEWPAITTEAAAFRRALADFQRLGAIIITGAPTVEGTVVEVAELFGHVRDTNFGRLFDVRSVPAANDLAYTSVPLGPHTDNPYRDPVPGIQLLHCLVNGTSGGLSTLVDSMAVTDMLRGEDSEGFELLATVPVQFRFNDAQADIRHRRTVIQRDHSGVVTGLAYSPRLDYLPMMSPENTRAYQRARQRLAELLVDAAFEIRFVLQPGEVEMFDNARVLHGRTGFDPQEGLRHLQGCYIDVDAPRSRYRVLNRGDQ